MEIILLIMENHGKIIELCFLISVGTLNRVDLMMPGYLDLHCCQKRVIRDYHKEVWLSPEESTQDPIISPRALALFDTEGDNQTPCYNLIITYSNSLFQRV